MNSCREEIGCKIILKSIMWNSALCILDEMVGFCDSGKGSPCSVVTENVLISKINITSEVTPYPYITDLTPCTLYIMLILSNEAS